MRLNSLRRCSCRERSTPARSLHPGCRGYSYSKPPQAMRPTPEEGLDSSVTRKGRPWSQTISAGGGGVDVAVRGEGEAEMPVPATAGADGVEETLHVFHHGLGRIAGQHAFEMVPGQVVIPREEESAGQFETRTREDRGCG